MRIQRVLAAGLAALVLPLGLASPARADFKGTDDIVAKSKGQVLRHTWEDRKWVPPTPCSGRAGCAGTWSGGMDGATGTKGIRWIVAEVQSKRDKKYNYYYAQVDLANNVKSRGHVLHSPADVRIGVHGGKVSVADKVYTRSSTIGAKCSSFATVGLNAGFGLVSVGSANAEFTLCGGGSKVTARSTAAGEVLWHMSDFQNVKSAQFYLFVMVKAGYQPDFQINTVTPNDTFKGKTVNSKYLYQQAKSGTYCKASKTCLAG